MKVIILLVTTLCLACSTFAKTIPTRFVTALQRALDADATWTMTKTLPTLQKPILSAGEVSCWKERGMIWKTIKPYEEEIRISKSEMVFLCDGEVETTPCDEMPYYEEICTATDNFLAGDTDDFEDLFSWTWNEQEDGSWTMTLDVEYRQMRRLFSTITLSGNETLTSVTFTTGPDAKQTTQLQFKEVGQATHRLWPTETPQQ